MVKIGDCFQITPQGIVSTVPPPPGPQGPQGAQGEPGPRGQDGRDGVPGLQGPAGSDGWSIQGDPGPTGAQGAQGSPGIPGPPGAVSLSSTGPTGPQGEAGRMGAPGIPGAVGLPGAPGPTGEAGVPGSIGPTGPKGEVVQQLVLTSVTGPTGPVGSGSDSERGKWTAQLSSSRGTVIVLANQDNEYVRVGDSVTAFFDITVQSIQGGDDVATLTISNLPFQSRSGSSTVGQASFVMWNSVKILPVNISGLVQPNSMSVELWCQSSKTLEFSKMIQSDIDINTRLVGSVSYTLGR